MISLLIICQTPIELNPWFLLQSLPVTKSPRINVVKLLFYKSHKSIISVFCMLYVINIQHKLQGRRHKQTGCHIQEKNGERFGGILFKGVRYDLSCQWMFGSFVWFLEWSFMWKTCGSSAGKVQHVHVMKYPLAKHWTPHGHMAVVYERLNNWMKHV